MYLVSGDLERAERGIMDRVTRHVPRQSPKIVLVAWQILTQVKRGVGLWSQFGETEMR